MNDCIDSQGDANILTTLECYYQLVNHLPVDIKIPVLSLYYVSTGIIPVETKCRDKTVFISHEVLYRFTRMSFRLKNAPGTF